ncbi:hem peroxidase [Dillenia turbinata]|uniref:Hem peroxidase n=1 Tax=Dillenia turbinata TaxID=194707 RepID=A0AAN8V7B0_9MAGN
MPNQSFPCDAIRRNLVDSDFNFPQLEIMSVAPVVDADYLKEIERARRDLRALISSKQCAPLMLRLALNDAETYDANAKRGGPDGSIRFEEVYKRKENEGLEEAIKFCEELKAKHPKITYADLYQLAGVVAVEVTGGPTIDFFPGRKDSLKPPKEGLLPDATKGVQHLKDIFYRMGISDKDIVALSGGRTLGKAKDPMKFDNTYFKELLENESKGTADKGLLEDPTFRRYVKLYADNEEAFFKDYAASHKKLSELGFTQETTVPPSKFAGVNTTVLAQGAVAVIVAAAVVFLSYYYHSHRRVKK